MQKRIESGTYGRNLRFNYLEWIERMANSLGLCGVVTLKNDGSIYVVAEGEEQDLIVFANRMARGKFFTHMENFYVNWSEPRGEFEDFSISEALMEDY